MTEEIKETKVVKDVKPEGKPPKAAKPEGKPPPKGAKPATAAGEVAAAATTAEGAAVPAIKVKKKIKKNVSTGVVHIQATFNNTIITVTDTKGNVLCWATSGAKGFKGSKKGTPFAAQLASETACRKASDYGMKSVTVYIRGPGAGRESALRAIAHAGLRVTSIRDLTPLPHNGCRPPKQRRV